MIRIISGIYGFRDGKRTRPISYRDGAFSADPEEEERLVAAGIAEYIGAGAAAESEPVKASGDAGDLEAMETNTLRQYAKSIGVGGGGSRAEVLTRIKEARAAEDVASGEDAPVFAEAMPS